MDAASAVQIGMIMGVASMISIGPNNLMLIREGLARGRVGLVAGLVAVSEVALIATAWWIAAALGTLGPEWRDGLCWAGLAALCWFAFQSLRAAARPAMAADLGGSRRACLFRVACVVWLNPLAYIELLIVPAALSQSFGSPDARLGFFAGLIATDVFGCYAYAYGARGVAHLLRRGVSLRLFDLASGIVLSAIALTMAAGLLIRGGEAAGATEPAGPLAVASPAPDARENSMVRDPRRLDQNTVVIDPANVDAVLDDRPTPATSPLNPPDDNVHNDSPARGDKTYGQKTRQTVDGSRDGTPDKPRDSRR